MIFRNFSKEALISLVISIFLLIISSGLAQAKDNQVSPLFKESLQETLQEFSSGTKKILNNSQKKIGQKRLREMGQERKNIRSSRCPTRPTFRASTCRGLRCYGFPTLIGRATCSPTCGFRATCSHGWFCRHPPHPSPCAKLDNQDRLAKGTSSFNFTIF